jgi:hypothetical protein
LPWAIFFRAFSPGSRAGRRQEFQPEFFRNLHHARDVLLLLQFVSPRRAWASIRTAKYPAEPLKVNVPYFLLAARPTLQHVCRN